MKSFIQTQCPAIWFSLLCCLTLLLSCNNKGQQSPQGYDLAKPEKMELGKVLNEISGITFSNDYKALYAISDSKEKVFEISLKKFKLKDYTNKIVGPHSDLEDIVCIDSTLYLLGSNGTIYEVLGKDSTRPYKLAISGNNDFETLYHDPTTGGLIMVCKTCEIDKGTGVKSAFRFNLSSKTFDSAAFYVINRKDLDELVNEEGSGLKPSAAAINPVNKRVYMLASAEQMLAVLDNRGKIMEAYPLPPELFPQAEGIAFAPNGDMYISNEGKYGNATLLLYRYHQEKNPTAKKSK